MAEGTVQAALASLQKRGPGETTSLFQHLTEIAIHLKNNQSDSVDVCQLSALLKKQAQPVSQSDSTLPCSKAADGTATKDALQMFGCDPQLVDVMVRGPDCCEGTPASHGLHPLGSARQHLPHHCADCLQTHHVGNNSPVRSKFGCIVNTH